MSKPINQAPPITIWVHGTFFLPNKLLPKFFYCPTGLNLAASLDKSYHHRIIAESLANADPNRFPLEAFYLFGWESKLSFPARQQAAQELYTALKQLVADYQKKYKQQPTIRIITHSHGGNVVLNMADLIQPEDQIKINELIILAAPVQERTKQFTQSPLFENIISFFSPIDALQVLDPQGLYPQEIRDWQKEYQKEQTPILSARTFEAQPNLIQAKTTINGRGLFHIEFMLQRFLQSLPAILDELQSWQQTNNKAHEQIYQVKLTS